MSFQSGFKIVYHIGDAYLEETTGLKTKTGKPVIYSEIIQQYNKDNQFVDIDFPTDDSSVDAKNLGFDKASGKSKAAYEKWDRTVIWKRPYEALKLHNQTNLKGNEPKVDEIRYVFSQASIKDMSAQSRFDITQGRVGDCWFVSSLSQITQMEEVISFVVPKDNQHNNFSGAYHFRFNYFCEWVDVVVDDYIPLFEEKGPGTGYTIMICKPPHEKGVYEIWPLLVEKAYAKIQGNITQINGGLGLFALEDLTGGIGEHLSIKGISSEAKLFEKLMALNKISFVNMGTPGEERLDAVGLKKCHAYCVTALTSVAYKGEQVQLVRLRNPWGHQEWNGAWSESSTEFNELSEDDKKKVGLVVEDDGEFWISAKDALEYFESIEACYWFPEKLLPMISKLMDIQTYHSVFTKDNSNADEPWNNPQFVIEVNGESEECVILAHVQVKCKMQDRTCFPGAKCFKIIDPSKWSGNKFPKEFFADANNSKEYKLPVEFGIEPQPTQQRNTVGFQVPPGNYVIVTSLETRADYGFVLRLSGQIVSTGSIHSMFKPVELTAAINTDTGIARTAEDG